MTPAEAQRLQRLEYSAARAMREMARILHLAPPEAIASIYDAINLESVTRFDLLRCKALRDDAVRTATRDQYQRQIDACAGRNEIARGLIEQLEAAYPRVVAAYHRQLELNKRLS